MLIVPIIITIGLYAMAKKYDWEDNVLKVGIFVCWLVFIALFAYDMLGDWFGWWTNVELV